ncbi:MAG: DUF2079 domain-containing protein [Desulfurivibrionaceae bacterium]
MKPVMIRGSFQVKALQLVILLHGGLFFFLGMNRHWGYLSSINDLGVFDQVVWNTLNGAFFQTTINPFGVTMNWLGFHFHPVLLLFVPLYWLYAGVEWFMAAQAAALALGAWPIFLLAEHQLKSEKAGIAWALIYLFNPFLLNAGGWDFHPITLAVPFIATAFLGIVQKNGRMLFWSSLAILLCKEHLGLMVVGFGILWWIKHRSWKTAVVISGLGLTHLFMVLGVAMPCFSPIGKPVMLGEGLGQLSRYGWLGGSPPEILQTFLIRPGFVWQRIIDMGGHIYWLLLVIPFSVVLPLFGFSFLLPGLADLAANTLSANPMPRSIWAYHSVGLVPILTAAAIGGVARLSTLQWRFSGKELSGISLAVALVCGYFFLPLPLKGAFNIWEPVNYFNWSDPSLRKVRLLLAEDFSLSAQANIGAQFSRRPEIFLYPGGVGETDGIVLRLASPTAKINDMPANPASLPQKNHPNWLDGHLQMDRTEYLASTECLLAGGEYGAAYWDDPWLVLLKGTGGDLPAVTRKIGQLKEAWRIDDAAYRGALAGCSAAY